MTESVKGDGAIKIFGGNSKDALKAVIERIERLNESIKELNDDKRDVFAEAKGNGFHVKALKTIVQMRAKDKDALIEEEAILDTYLQALGMRDD